MERYRVEVFTTEPGKGNPAAVVLGGDTLSEAAMGEMAASLGIETTFITGDSFPTGDSVATGDRSGPVFRYYQPSKVAMLLCGHGTLAGLAVLGRKGQLGRFTIATPAGELPVSIEPNLLGMAMPPVTLGEPMDPQIAAQGLGIDLDAIDGPVRVGSAGRPKLLIPLRSTAVLDGLAPDPAAVVEACQLTGTTGLYPFTLAVRSNGTTIGATADARHFPAGAGMFEDPVTGVGAVPLAWHLWQQGAVPEGHPVTIEQGHAMGRPGVALIRQEGDGRTWIYGTAIVREEGR